MTVQPTTTASIVAGRIARGPALDMISLDTRPGADVRLCRRALRELGYRALTDIDKPSTLLDHSIRDLQAKHGLFIDGFCGPRTWLVICKLLHDREGRAAQAAVEDEPSPLRNRIVAIAQGFVGVQERGHNAGPEVEMFQRWAGGNASVQRHDAWCAAFCDYVYEKACAELKVRPLLNIGLSVPQLRQHALHAGLLLTDAAKAKHGDLWIWKDGTRYRHVEIVTAAPRQGYVSTIGGNTSAGRGSVNEGDGVYQRRRATAGNLFVRLAA